ncbi:hypothetical protein GCM10018980_22400 [Streptomyces capoamus]|uniref:Uncharacterized protein n=1 Tax=Streptomyces capoamus TaxID=68183 RepID=A0A919EVG0_9ACTN|nr:hypothetical protein GCM10010501_01510 [Streptomyces libani subsp. rufus]GHG44490.1 hypothetical protein GCM10018980_22400 [Streptomyces capoamus]
MRVLGGFTTARTSAGQRLWCGALLPHAEMGCGKIRRQSERDPGTASVNDPATFTCARKGESSILDKAYPGKNPSPLHPWHPVRHWPA